MGRERYKKKTRLDEIVLAFAQPDDDVDDDDDSRSFLRSSYCRRTGEHAYVGYRKITSAYAVECRSPLRFYIDHIVQYTRTHEVRSLSPVMSDPS